MAFDTGFELLPADGIAGTADLALDAALGHIPDDPATLDTIPYGRGWDFDFEKGQFIRNGFEPAQITGLANLRVWIEKTLRTARFAHAIYSDEHGMEAPFDLIGANLLSPAIGLYASAVTDALLVHDRITAVGSFGFTSDDDALFVSFAVTTDSGDTLTFDAIGLT